MKKLILAAALLAGGSLLLQDISTGHGGTYRGPGDTVPPGAGGGGGGGGPSTPGPAGPSAPGGAGPSTPGPATPGAPGSGPGGAAAMTQVTDSGPDLTQWTFWWEFNKDPYLNLKSKIHSGRVVTGSDDFFLGRGQNQEGHDSMRPSEIQIRDAVVPALLKSLETETNNDIVTGCMLALAKIGDEKSEDGKSAFEAVISKFLSDSNQEIAETAAVALGVLANPVSVAKLADLVEDTPAGRAYIKGQEVNYRTRAFAAYGLGLIAKRTSDPEVRAEIVRRLFGVLRSDKTRTKDLGVACVISLGLASIDEANYEPTTAVEGATTLSTKLPIDTRKGQIVALLDYMHDEANHFLIRAHVPTALARLCDGLAPERYEALKAQICESLLTRSGSKSKEQPEIIQSCVMALGLFGDDDNDKLDADIRKTLMEGPSELRDTQAKHFSRIALAYAAARPGRGAESGAATKEVTNHFLDQLAKSKGSLRSWNAIGAGIFGRRRGEVDANSPANPAPALAAALRAGLADTKSPIDIGAYAISLGMLGDKEAKGQLLTMVDKVKEEQARGYCCLSLGMLGAQEAVDPIKLIVSESMYRPDLLRQAAISLGLLGDKDMVDGLVKMLNEAKSLASQASLASALGFIGDTRSVDPLVTLLQDKEKTEGARGFAAVALGIVADKENLPWNSKIAVDLNYRASTETLNLANEGTGILNIL